MKTEKKWQPLVADTTGEIRERFRKLSEKTGIKKSALSSKIFRMGLSALEKAAAEERAQ